MARLLLANDDGIDSPGLHALAEALEGVGHRVRVCAPDRERSAQSHALTVHKPLRADELRPGWWSISGTPADCVYLGLNALLEEPPELVLSGINRGSNAGHDVYYSGTVAAAMEASLSGVPAVAVSLAVERGPRPPRWDAAAGMAVRVVRELLARSLPPLTLLNLNVPNLPPEELLGLRSAHQGARRYEAAVDTRRDPRGRPYYWIGGDLAVDGMDPSSDGGLLREGWATLTPIEADMTRHEALVAMSEWTDDA